MMKPTHLILAAFLAAPFHLFAADVVKIDLYTAGTLKQSISLVGVNASVKVANADIPNSLLELRLIAPEPVIVEVKETSADGAVVEAVGRVKLLAPGSSFALSEIKGAKFHSPYVFVRSN